MEHLSYTSLLLIFLVTLIGETYGTIFGGGGFLIQPALIALGVPPHIVIANDIAAATATDMTSAYIFHKKKYKINWKLFLYFLPGILVAPWLANYALGETSPEILKKLVMVFCLLGAFFMLVHHRSEPKTHQHFPPYWRVWALLGSLVLTFYAVYSGAGSATLIQMFLMMVFGYTHTGGMAIRNYMLMIPQALGAIAFFHSGWIYAQVIIPMLAACILAGYMGTHIAHRMNEKLLRKIFFIAVLVMAAISIFRG